jgi:hypothetical protein
MPTGQADFQYVRLDSVAALDTRSHIRSIDRTGSDFNPNIPCHLRICVPRTAISDAAANPAGVLKPAASFGIGYSEHSPAMRLCRK